MKCDGDKKRVGWYRNINECSHQCKTISSMFAYGRRGTIRCNETACECQCMIDVHDGQCAKGKKKSNGNFDLYRIQAGKIIFH